LRVLHIDTGTGWRGGQQQVLWLLQGAATRGLQQTLLAPADSPLASRARSAGVDVSPLSLSLRSRANWKMVRELARRCDLVHAHDAHAHTLALAAVHLTGRRNPPLVVSRRVGFPIPATGRLKYAAAARYLAVSDHVRWRLLEAGVPAQKIRVVLDGVRPPTSLPGFEVRREFRTRQGAPENAFVIGTLSTFAPEKRLPETLQVMTHLPPEIHFWVGVPAAEPDRDSAGAALLQEAHRRGLEQRFQIIPVPENPGPFLSALDLFLYLSRSEGLGSAILLAMAYGLPVAASAVGGIPEIVRHLVTGVLLDGESLGELPEAIVVLKHSPPLRQRLGAAGRAFVLGHATDDRMVAQTIAIYAELLEESRHVDHRRDRA
jgi:glycosyltransferase involved in cell wall biosynthesis